MNFVSRSVSGAVAALAWLTISQHAHATACPEPLACTAGASLNLVTTQLDDGRWQYDYTFDLQVNATPYDPWAEPGAPVIKSASYRFAEMRLPYFADAGITNLKVGSAYADVLTAAVIHEPIGHATQSILVYVGESPFSINTIQPDAVVGGVNSLMSFISDYAPVAGASATVSLLDMYGDVQTFKTPSLRTVPWDRVFSNPVGMPGSPSAVPEPHAILMVLAGLGAVAAARRARSRPA